VGQRSIGSDSTHGCIRLDDEDLAWVWAYVPVGVTVVVK
jgi:lipoprotein-anchoring transpeptidase ErfK/SrfK